MTGGYLKQLQLTRQLEELARRAARDRKAAEKTIEEASELIASAKEMGISVADAQKLLVEAEQSFSEKDYKDALALATKAVQKAKESKRRTVEHILEEAENLIKMFGVEGADAPLNLIEKGRSSIREDSLDEAYLIAKEAWDRAEQFANARMADLLEKAQSWMLLAESEGKAVEGERELLDHARKSLETADYKKSLEHVKSCIDSLRESLTDLFKNRRKRMEELIVNGENLGIDFERVRSLIAEANELFENGEMEEAFSHLRVAEGELRRTLAKGVLSKLNELEGETVLLEKYTPAGDIKSMIAECRGLVSKGEIERAFVLYKETEKLLREKQLEVLTQQLAALKPKIQIARLVRADIQKVLESIVAAKRAWKEGNFEGAMDMVHTADALLEEELREYREVENELKIVDELMSTAEQFDVPIEKARQIVRMAREFVRSGSLDLAMERLKAAQRILHAGIQQYLGREILNVELYLAAAMRMGEEVQEENELLEAIMARVKNGDYRGAWEALADCFERVKETVRSRAEKTVEKAASLVEQYRDLLEVSPIMVMIGEARAAMEKEDFEKAYHLASRAINQLEGERNLLVNTRFKQARKLLEICRELGEESSTLEEKLKEAEKLGLDSRADEALGLLGDLIQLASIPVREWTEKQLDKLSGEITAARNDGIETGRVERQVDKVKQLLKEERITEAYDTLVQAREMLSEIIGNYKNVREMIEELTSMIGEAKTRKIDTGGIEGEIERINGLLKKGDYAGAARLAEKVLDEAERTLAPITAPEKIREAENMVATARRLKQDVSAEEVTLSRAGTMLRSGDYAGALSAAKQVIDGARGKIREALERELIRARELLEKAERTGADVSSLREITDRAERMIREWKIGDALRAISLVQNELDQELLMERKAAEGIDRAADLILSVEKIGADPGEAGALLKQAREQMKKGRYGIAVDLAKKAADKAGEAGREFINKRMRLLEMNYNAMNLEGPDLNRAAGLKTEIQELMAQNRFNEAFSLVRKMEEELERVSAQKELSEKTVREVEKEIETARASGLVSSKVEGYLKKAKESLEQGAFTTAFFYASRCADELNSLREMYDRRRAELEKLKEEAMKLAEEGIDVTTVNESLKAAESALAELDFQGSTRHLRRGSRELASFRSELIERKRKELQSLIRLADKAGVEVQSEAASVLAGRLDNTAELDAAIVSLKEMIATRLEEIKGEVTGRIEVARNSGADTSTSEYLLEQANEKLKAGDLEETFRLLKESEESIGTAVEARREYMELRMRCESLIEHARRNGLRMEEAAALFERAETARKRDYREAIELMKEALAKAEEEVSSYIPELGVDLEFPEKPVAGQWNRTVMTVRNDSIAMVRDVEIGISGEIDIRGLEPVRKIRGRESAVVEFEAMPRRSGRLHVSVTLKCRPVLSDDEFRFDYSFEIEAE